MKKRTVTLCMVLFVAALGLSGCKKKETKQPVEKIQAQTELTEEAEPVTKTHEGEAKSLLTGEWIDETLAAKRPVALMIENTEAALPQYNIGKADLIYECPVEGGITRLMGLYQDYSGMERMGNVRSCRLYYVYFAKEFDAIYVHAGESKYAVDLLDSDFIDNIDGIKAVGKNHHIISISHRMESMKPFRLLATGLSFQVIIRDITSLPRIIQRYPFRMARMQLLSRLDM